MFFGILFALSEPRELWQQWPTCTPTFRLLMLKDCGGMG